MEEEEGLGEKRRGERERGRGGGGGTNHNSERGQHASGSLSLSPPLLFSSLICLLLVGPTLLP